MEDMEDMEDMEGEMARQTAPFQVRAFSEPGGTCTNGKVRGVTAGSDPWFGLLGQRE
jgi:hypothetical protein